MVMYRADERIRTVILTVIRMGILTRPSIRFRLTKEVKRDAWI